MSLDKEKPNVLFIKGIADNQLAKIISYYPKPRINTGGSCNVFSNIESEDFHKYLNVFDSALKSKLKIPNKVDIIFNQISEPDTYKITLKKVHSLITQLNLKVINHPKKILNTTRDKIYKNLFDIPHLNVPKTLRINSKSPQDIISIAKKHKMTFPLLLREIGSHGGDNTFLVKNEANLKKLYAVALDGREYYLTKFYDFKDKSKLYTKYRLAVIDSEVYIRHAIISNDWNIHSESREDKYGEIEKEILEDFENNIKPKISNTIFKIHEKLELDYFGIDCSIDENFNILIFEINANMNILIKSNNYTDKYVIIIKQAIINMIKKRVENV